MPEPTEPAKGHVGAWKKFYVVTTRHEIATARGGNEMLPRAWARDKTRSSAIDERHARHSVIS